MTAGSLAQAYLVKARLRLEVLELLLARGGHSDVVREAQELVELATKSMLRRVGIEPPKWHDVGSILLENARLFPEAIRKELAMVADISSILRKEREFSFYGDEDFIPTEEYGRAEAEKALEGARAVLAVAERAAAG
ncbi:MAG: HEPN domain-containing protein [Myxococcales bacterium]|nr:HEPN domain-containing protein [Myxococcales bacterium]